MSIKFRRCIDFKAPMVNINKHDCYAWRCAMKAKDNYCTKLYKSCASELRASEKNIHTHNFHAHLHAMRSSVGASKRASERPDNNLYASL